MAILMIIMIGLIRIGWSLEWVVVREVRMGVWNVSIDIVAKQNGLPTD